MDVVSGFLFSNDSRNPVCPRNMPLIMSVATDGGLVINNRRPEPLTCCQEQQDGTYTKILELLGDIEKIIELVDAKQSVDAPKGSRFFLEV